MAQVRKTLRTCCIAVLCLVSAAAADTTESAERSEFDWGFIASRDTTLYGAQRTRVLGPLYETRAATNGNHLLALRPLMSHIRNDDEDATRTEVLWPISWFKEKDNQRSWNVFPCLYTDFDTTDPDSRYRFWVLPFLFKGRDINGRNYMAVFPLGGSVSEVLTLDRSDFVLWPLYVKNSKAGIETTNILWPIYASGSGQDVDKFRIFPIYGRETKGTEYSRGFFMWPFWTQASYNNYQGQGSGWVLFPLCGRTEREDRTSWMAIPPLIRVTHGKDGFREANMPYPFLQVSAGDTRKFYLWPLFGTKSAEGTKKSFAFWPIVSGERRTLSDTELNEAVVMPFLYSRTLRDIDDEGKREVAGRNVKLWPLLHYQRKGDTSRFRTLALWPALRSRSVERNYSPLWTLYSRERVGDSVDNELLWGLFRSRSTPSESRLSLFPLVSWHRSRENSPIFDFRLLMGALGFGKNENGRYLRFLFMKFGGTEKSE